MPTFNTTINESAFSDNIRDSVWKMGQPVLGYNPDEWRKDICGWWMKYSAYGNRDSQYGWEIDHVRPKALKGDDELSNLQPLNWQNNASKGDTYPWKCGQ